MSLMFCVLQNPAIADIYTEHSHQVTVAKYAPSGFYIASGGKKNNQKTLLMNTCQQMIAYRCQSNIDNTDLL